MFYRMILASSPGCTNVKMSSELKKIEGNFLSKPKNGYCPLDPNILFFCQIVALAVPISVLYGGLYFSSSSASIIAVVCGSIVLTVLCIIIATKPFSGSQVGFNVCFQTFLGSFRQVVNVERAPTSC